MIMAHLVVSIINYLKAEESKSTSRVKWEELIFYMSAYVLILIVEPKVVTEEPLCLQCLSSDQAACHLVVMSYFMLASTRTRPVDANTYLRPPQKDMSFKDITSKDD